MGKERLDIVVQRQAGVSRTQAQGLIRAGQVLDDHGQRLDKPGLRVPEDAHLDIREGPPFVSRGGEKLEAALDAFQLDVTGLTAIDIGASTGGFTDCLLQRGAAHVYAVDVGYGQLAWQLRQDSRVTVLERTNIRHLDSSAISDVPTFFTVDCSFIGLHLVLPKVKEVVVPQSEGVVLIKPQFEAGKESVERGGVVRDPAVHERVVEKVLDAARVLGFSPGRVIPSPLLGPAGNREFLAHLRLGRQAD